MKDNVFKNIVDRGKSTGSKSIKWEGFTKEYPNYKIDEENSIPMWIADMDYMCPQDVVDAVIQRAEHGIYGYSEGVALSEFYDAASEWYARRHGFVIDPKWMYFSPGIIPAVNTAIQEFTEAGEGVIVQPPVYYPFLDSIKSNKRETVYNQLVETPNGYAIDFDDLEKSAADPRNKLMILCTPHNPVGRVWTAEELDKIGEICLKNDVILFADEIHCDLLMENVKFKSFAEMKKFYDILILAHAPSKTFNIAGLQASIISSPNSELKKRMKTKAIANGIPGDNVFSTIAGIAAYEKGDEYAFKLMKQVEENVDYVYNRINSESKNIKMYKPEGTFLIWLNMDGSGLSPEEITRCMLEEVKVIGDAGEWFGPGGSGHVRLNVGCPKEYVEKATDRIIDFFK